MADQNISATAPGLSWGVKVDVSGLRTAPGRRVIARRAGIEEDPAPVDDGSRATNLPAAALASSSTLPKPTSKLASYPSPFAIDDAAEVRQLMGRTFSEAPDAQHTRCVDRVGRFMTPTAIGLTMAALKDHLETFPGSSLNQDPTVQAVRTLERRRKDSAARRQAKAKAGKRGPAVGGLRGPASRPGPAASASTSALPTLRTMAVSPTRRSTGRLPALGTSTGFGGTGPLGRSSRLTQVASAGVLPERAPAAVSPEQEPAMVELAIQKYWIAVGSAAPIDALAPFKRQWEDGALQRLGMSEGPPRPWAEPGPFSNHRAGRTFLPAGDNLGPGNHLTLHPGEQEAALPSGRLPADVVDEVMVDVGDEYVSAVRRSMVDYGLRSADPRHHRGLLLAAVDAGRFVPRPVGTADSCGVPPLAAPLARRALARRLFITERVTAALLAQWFDPERGLSSLRLLDLADDGMLHRMPLTTFDFTHAVQTAIDTSVSTLRSRWHREGVEAVAGFMLELRGDEEIASNRRAGTVRRMAGVPAVTRDSDAMEEILDAAEHKQLLRVFPQHRDYAWADDELARRVQHRAHFAASLLLSRRKWRRALQATGGVGGRATARFGASLTAGATAGAGSAGGSPAVRPGSRTRRLRPLGASGAAAGAGADEGKEEFGAAGFEGGKEPDAETRRRGPEPQTVQELLQLATPSDLQLLAVPGGLDLLAAHTMRATDPVGVEEVLPAEQLGSMRLDGALDAAAVLMERLLMDRQLDSVSRFSDFIAEYLEAEEAGVIGRAEHDVQAHEAANGGGGGGGAAVQAPAGDGAFSGLPPESEMSPIFRLEFALNFSCGGPEQGITPELATMAKEAEEAAAAEAAAEAAAPAAPLPGDEGAGGARAGDAEEVREGPARAPPLEEVNLDGHPDRLNALRNLWAGRVDVLPNPGWARVCDALLGAVDAVVTAGSGFARAEVEIRRHGERENEGEDGEEPGSPGMRGPEALGAGPATSLRSLPTWDVRVEALRRDCSRLVDLAAEGPERVRERFDRFMHLFSPDTKERLLHFCMDEENDVRAYRHQVEKLEAEAREVLDICRDIEAFPTVQIDTTAVKQAVSARARLLITLVCRSLKSTCMSLVGGLNRRFDYLETRLGYVPTSSELLVEHRTFVKGVPEELKQLERRIYNLEGAAAMCRFLVGECSQFEVVPLRLGFKEAHGPEGAAQAFLAAGPGNSMQAGLRRGVFTVGAASSCPTMEEGEQVRLMLEYPHRISDAMLSAREVLDAEKQGQVERLEVAVEDFIRALGQCNERITALASRGDISNVVDMTDELTTLRSELESLLERGESLNGEQDRLDQVVTSWTEDIQTALEAVGPYERLWESTATFVTQRDAWYSKPLLDVNPEDIDKEAEAARANAVRAVREMPEDAEEPAAMAKRMQQETTRFLQEHLPVMVLLANPGLKQRHWEDMEQSVGFELPHHRQTSLQDMLELGLERRVQDIEETCVNAQKEHSLEKALERMQEEWAPLQLDLKPHKNTGTFIVTGATVDEVQALLDDHIVKAQTMGASRYAKPLLGRIKEWTAALQTIQNVLDGWLKMQQQWLYLEPIFSSEDIMQQLPEEAARFKVVDKTWRQLMSVAVSDPRALTAMRQPGMEEHIDEANGLLDLISKGLNSYLETKRLYFPRFFFLSNDELLEILAETKDPTRVQPHLKKCFEGIKSLEFTDSLDIMAMFSDKGERVALEGMPETGAPINPKEARGNVEVWLLQVEGAMRRSVARVVDECVHGYDEDHRTDWVTSHSGQAVLGGTMIFWTEGIEAALRALASGQNESALSDYCDKLTGQINDIILLVRGKLAKLARQTLSALVVLDVHNRDVTAGMVAKGVNTLHDFEWSSQLRYYWKDDGASTQSGDPGSLELKMINARMFYANEYLGNQGRLVITPLTDRCYRTLMGAIHLQLGGAPEGPAGTGKTETVKDLAKAAGMMCVVFNCSDQLGVEEMAKFFKGLASCGAWSCFDEFNRIELEVLSVIAQQIMQIQNAIRTQQPDIVFHETPIHVRSTANCFITMNPGYAGRAELPDNLKALFRTVAMMVPDYAMIAEIILYSNGYLEAKAMARKIVATYKLCSEQLSSQYHYDYGMRAVMAVLRAAGNLKRQEQEAPEDQLVLRAIIDVNKPKFLQHDLPLFEGIVSDLYPGVEVPPPDRTLLEGALRRCCQERTLQAEPVVLEKVFQVYEMMIVRHGFMLVGLPWSGKTVAMKLLSEAMALLHEEHPEDERWAPIHLLRMNPKSITQAQLYGKIDETTMEWTNGVLSHWFRTCSKGLVGDAGDRQWMVFDGPVDAIWIENMNTVLDDNKKLCLMSGEIISMAESMNMVFETKDLAAASPATVSRCGMVYLEPHALGWKPVVASWLERLAEDNPRFPFRAAHPSDPEAKAREEAERKAAEEAELLALQGGGPEAAAGAGAGGHHRKRRKAAARQKDTRPFTLSAAQTQTLQQMFDWLVDPCLVNLRKQCHEYVPTQDTTLVQALCDVLECSIAQMVEACDTEAEAAAHSKKAAAAAAAGGKKKAPKATYAVGGQELPAKRELDDQDLRQCFVHSLLWSVAATVDAAGRSSMSEFIRGAVTQPGFLGDHALAVFFRLRGWEAPPQAPQLSGLPADGHLHDHFYSPGEGKWRSWEDLLPKVDIPKGATYESIIVPTVATAQVDHFVPLMVERRRNVLLCGPTGTGKSALLTQLLLRKLPATEYLPIIIGFSAQTSANMTQDQVDRRLERRRKGVYGPRPGMRSVVFVDDLNMPQVEEYGAQPPIELLRQMVDMGGWYNLEELAFMKFEDTQLLSAMGPPGGGRNSVSPRILRHLLPLCMTDMAESSLTRIFSAIVGWFLVDRDFPQEMRRLDRCVVSATRRVYDFAIAELRPTPAKSHYKFNLRDFSRVVEGITMAKPEQCGSAESMARLWVHETLRVFHDRLTTPEDRTGLIAQVRELTKSEFGKDFNTLCAHLPGLNRSLRAKDRDADAPESPEPDARVVTDDDVRLLMWGDYFGSSSSKRPYCEMEDSLALVKAVDESLEEFNSQTKKPMDLVPFLFFLEHVSRIARVLKMPGGHALLVGVGGSGRRCATRLAAYMAGQKTVQIELSKSYGREEWGDDLRRIMREAGTGPQGIVFVFPDTQIKWQGMVEDINNILNSGEVPNLFPPEERAEVLELVSPLARAAGRGKDLSPAELWAYFVERCRANLHVVLAMSPIGDAFRDRLRKFPSLVNCCTIDWFTAWPEDALRAVADKQLHQVEVPTETKRSLALLCGHFHRSARDLSEAFASELRRHYYVTPTSYLELLSQFCKSLGAKRGEVSAMRSRYLIGLEKLSDAETQVATLKEDLIRKQPLLAQSQKETAELMEVIQEKLPGVEETRASVKADADVATAEAERVDAERAACQAELDVAMPALESAIRALDTVKEADIKFLRGLGKPPAVIIKVMSAVLVMLGQKPDKIKDPDGGLKKVDDYWGPAKRRLGDSKQLLEDLKTYDKDNIEPKVMAKIRETYVPDPEFNQKRAEQASSAAAGMCAWVLAMDVYDRVAKVVAPKKIALAEAEATLAVTMGELREKQAALQAVEDELAGLQSQFDAANKKKKELEDDIDLCGKKLVRAEQLIGGLGGEKARWTEEAQRLGVRLEALTGDILLSSGVVSYLGAFTMHFRQRCLDDWLEQCTAHSIVTSATAAAAARPAAAAAAAGGGDDDDGDGDEGGEGKEEGEDGGGASAGSGAFSLASTLGDPIKIRQWRIDGLPTDSFSTDNGVIVQEARRWPLMIDPQGQANKWVKNMEKDHNLAVLKQTDAGFLRSLENAVQFGQPVLLENVSEELDPALEPILMQQKFKQGAAWVIRIGDSTVEYDDKFRLYITTKLRNPHYLPETCVKVTLLNFMITPDGLTDQLLGVVVAEERPDLEKARVELLVQQAENARQLKELEDRILEVLSSNKGDILEDETAIRVLGEAKTLSNEIAEKQAVAAKTEAEIDATRAGYRPVAEHAACLFFVTADMGNIDPMYQYSMTWFSNLFILSIRNSKKSDNLGHRISSLNNHFTYSLYRNVCRSLFEKDKLLFSMLLCVKIMMGRGEVDATEWYFLLTGGVAMENPHENPAAAWLAEKSWGELCRLSDLEAFHGLREHVQANPADWKGLYDDEMPHRADIPGRWGQLGGLTRMQRILILRCLRPDKVVLAVQDFVSAQMGEQYLKPPPFDLQACYDDSNPGQPLIFVLSPGSDPMAALMSYAESAKAHISQISLGQGQGKFAEEMIEEGRKAGHWVVLQNCHLAVSWMPRLEKICEDLADAAAGKAGFEPLHDTFRLWTTSYPSEHFPVSILQNGVKMTNEPPKGLRANLTRSYLSDPICDPKFFGGVANAQPFRRLLFGLCFFHAMVQERRQFGALGWNIPYEFNESDLRISVQQLAMFLDDPDYAAPAGGSVSPEAAVPYVTLQYLTGQCNYGGRVTDDKDRRLLLSILDLFYGEHIHRPDMTLSPSGLWKTPPEDVSEHKQYMKFIEGLPAVPEPEVFGLHANATITKDQNETHLLFSSVLLTERGGGGGGGGGDAKSRDDVVAEVAADILAKLRDDFDLEEIGGRYPVRWEDSMNTVLRQELARYNDLLATVRTSLVNVGRALKGLVVMSSQLEGVCDDLFFGRVPALWMGKSYPSLKPLAGYVSDLLERVAFLDDWIDNGTPKLFWLPGFFFTQSFLTGVLQNFARKYTVAIDEAAFDVELLSRSKESVRSPPEDGVYIWGLYFDGCRWNPDRMLLDESEPKQLFDAAPLMWLRPKRAADLAEYQNYECPVYRTSERRGMLSTTGHSTNFVMMLRIPTDKPASHWTRRGVAMLLALDD